VNGQRARTSARFRCSQETARRILAGTASPRQACWMHEVRRPRRVMALHEGVQNAGFVHRGSARARHRHLARPPCRSRAPSGPTPGRRALDVPLAMMFELRPSHPGTACLKERVLSTQCSPKRSPTWGFCPANGGSRPGVGRASPTPHPRRIEGRAVKAGRRPPAGEALTARSSSIGSWMSKPARASQVRPPACRGTRALVVSSSPRVVRVRRGRSSAAWSCLRRAPSPGPSMERSGAASSAQSLVDDPPFGGHAVTRAVCWLRPSWLSSPRPAPGNGSPRHAGRSRRAGAPFWPPPPGRC
jgi:hypothetical protein